MNIKKLANKLALFICIFLLTSCILHGETEEDKIVLSLEGYDFQYLKVGESAEFKSREAIGQVYFPKGEYTDFQNVDFLFSFTVKNGRLFPGGEYYQEYIDGTSEFKLEVPGWKTKKLHIIVDEKTVTMTTCL